MKNKSSKKPHSQSYVYQEIWNKNNPDDIITKGDGFVIHHKDGDGTNNAIENLEKMLTADHIRLHMVGYKHTEKTKQRISESQSGEENHFYGKKHSKETREKISLAKTGKTIAPRSEEAKMKDREVKLGPKHPRYVDVPGEDIRSMKLQGMSMQDIADHFGVSLATIYAKWKSYKEKR